MTTKYQRGNKFSDKTTVSDAAVDWEQLPQEELASVLIDSEGFPAHAKYPELRERAQAIYQAASTGSISGLTHNEDGYTLPPNLMQLNRTELLAFIKSTDKRLGAERPLPRLADEAVGKSIRETEKLLRLDEVCSLVGLKQSAIYKKMKEGKFPKNTHERSTRWTYSVIALYMANQSIELAKGTNTQNAAEPAEDDEI